MKSACGAVTVCVLMRAGSASIVYVENLQEVRRHLRVSGEASRHICAAAIDRARGRRRSTSTASSSPSPSTAADAERGAAYRQVERARRRQDGIPHRLGFQSLYAVAPEIACPADRL